MKISETTSYPHPVLTPWSSDIEGASFTTAIQFRENGDRNQVSIHFQTQLDHPDIVHLIKSGAAGFGCYIRCQDTGMRRLQRIGFPSGVHHFAPGALLGRVQLRPMIWAVKEIPGYSPAGAHPEFTNGSDIQPGEILALDDEQTIDVIRPPLAPLESIFEIIASEEVKEGEFVVDTEADRITVRMAEATYQLVQALRQTDDLSRVAVMNALFVPVVMEVLERLQEGLEQFEQYRWLHPFRARCEATNIDLENPDLLSDAQRLLDKPFALLQRLTDQGN